MCCTLLFLNGCGNSSNNSSNETVTNNSSSTELSETIVEGTSEEINENDSGYTVIDDVNASTEETSEQTSTNTQDDSPDTDVSSSPSSSESESNCLFLEENNRSNDIIKISENNECLEPFIDKLIFSPDEFLDSYLAMVSDPALTDLLFLSSYSRLSGDFRFNAQNVEELMQRLPGEIDKLGAHSRRQDWQNWILARLKIGELYKCPDNSDLSFLKSLEVMRYGDYYCAGHMFDLLANHEMLNSLDEIINIVSNGSNDWSRRNAVTFLGTIANQHDTKAYQLFIQSRSYIESIIINRLETETSEQVIPNLIWLVDDGLFPLFDAESKLISLSQNRSYSDDIRFRSMRALTRMKSQLEEVSEQTIKLICESLKSNNSWVRAEAAYMAQTLITKLSSEQKEYIFTQLLNSYELEKILHASVSIAKALDAISPANRVDSIKSDFESENLNSSYGDKSVKILSGLSKSELPPILELTKNVRSEFFGLLGSNFISPVYADVNQNITLKIFADKEIYQEYMNAFIGYGANNGGLYVESQGTLYTFERMVWESTYTLEELIQHEYTHALVGRYIFPGKWGDIGYFDEPRAWADEGLAELLASYEWDNDGEFEISSKRLNSSVCNKPYKTLESLINQREGYDEAGLFDYNNGWIFMRYLFEKHPESAHRLFQSWRDNEYHVSDFAEIAGFNSIFAMEQEWHSYIESECQLVNY